MTLRAALAACVLLAAPGCVSVVMGGGLGLPGVGSADSPEIRVARAYFEALGSKDVEGALDLYSDDVRLWVQGSLPFSGSYDRKQARAGLAGLYESFPEGLEFTITGITQDGQRLALEVESRAVHASGTPYHNRYHYLFVIRGGKIREMKEYLDTLHAYEVMVQEAP